MCGLAAKYQVNVESNAMKSRCRGCGTIFYNNEKK